MYPNIYLLFLRMMVLEQLPRGNVNIFTVATLVCPLIPFIKNWYNIETSQLVSNVNQRTGLCIIRLLLKGISGEISGFNGEILIYLFKSCVFFIIFKFVSSSTIYNNY